MNGPRPLLLVVDDRPETLLSLERILGTRHQTLMRARSGQEALALVQKQDVAGILLAFRMQAMDGLETAQAIRATERSRELPIVFLTDPDLGLSQLARGYALGAVDHVERPIQPEILRAKVTKVVDHYRKGKQEAKEAQTLARLDEELRWVYEQLGLFSYTVAHDLRAPLRTMACFSQLLREDYSGKPFDEEGQYWASRIEDGARRMDTLISELLEYCRIAQTKETRVKIEPGPLIHQGLELAKAGASAPGMDVSVSEGLPPVLGHPDNLRNVFQQLLSSALQERTPGVKPSVRITHETTGEWLRIWIDDSSMGISPEHHERLFKPFERIDPRTSIGTGMGLALSKVAIERMGGRIGVESVSGRGTRLWVDLSLWQEEPGGLCTSSPPIGNPERETQEGVPAG